MKVIIGALVLFPVWFIIVLALHLSGFPMRAAPVMANVIVGCVLFGAAMMWIIKRRKS